MGGYYIRWLGTNEPPTGRVTVLPEHLDFAEATWEATRLLRAKITNERAAVNAGLYGNGFKIEEVS